MNRATRIAHLSSVLLMAAGVLAATGVGFAQSWAGLYGWAIGHGLEGWKAASFPAMVDVFILVGELGLFALTLEGHRLRRSALSWVDLLLPGGIAAAGWGVSLAFNVGHVDHDPADQITAAVPPVAAMLGLLVLLRTLHRLVTRHEPASAATVTAEVAEPGGPAAGLPWFPLPVLGPVSPIAPDAGGAADGPAEILPGDTGNGEDPATDSATLADDATAGQDAVRDLDSAIRAAKASGLGRKAIAQEFGVSEWRVRKALERQADDQDTAPGDEPAEVAR